MAGNLAFGQRVRELREARKRTDPCFSLRQFAQTLGVSATFISKMETGQFDPPSAHNIKRMAGLLKADAYELLQLAGKPDPDVLELVKRQPRAVADFLRTVGETGASEADLHRLTRQLKGAR